ncbi:unnamed protein product [Phytophthora lilii]|uniref:Unnamed protein product n=1 Tax=Phytophthora lilii TaxID=2077276 RepID=A0A9W7CQD8_9STRA|nr:unnamed protein product [Phytophthora lilii]
MSNTSTATLRTLRAAKIPALLATSVDPAETSRLGALGTRWSLASLAASVCNTKPSTHHTGGASVNSAFIAATVCDATSTALGCLLAELNAASS